jgi:site-specific DNA-methyltransferase (adenine-specific)
MVESFINKIHQGDCLDLLKQLPDNSVDMTFADPPFNLKKGYKSYKDNLALQKYLDWCETWILEMVRVTKPTGSIYLHNIPKWLTYYADFLNKVADFKHWISWDAPTMPMGKTLQPNHYGILFYAKNAKTLKFYEVRYPHKRDRKTSYLSKDYGGKKAGLHPFGSLLSDVWTDIHRIKHNKYRDEHPCQLPVHLLERLILMSTDANDIVLDPFNGTGTTALAAKRLGRQFIGFELDQEYVEITKNKLAQEQANSKLGNCWVSFYLGKVITLRDCDWNELKEYFIIPNRPEDIDYTPIVLKEKNNIISSPKEIQKENQSLQLFDIQSL